MRPRLVLDGVLVLHCRFGIRQRDGSAHGCHILPEPGLPDVTRRRQRAGALADAPLRPVPGLPFFLAFLFPFVGNLQEKVVDLDVDVLSVDSGQTDAGLNHIIGFRGVERRPKFAAESAAAVQFVSQSAGSRV